MAFKDGNEKSIGLCMDNFILCTDVPPKVDIKEAQCNISSTTHTNTNFDGVHSIELQSDEYHTISDISSENPIQKKIVSSSFNNTLNNDYENCDEASLMTLGKDIIFVCASTDSSQELEEAAKNKYVPIKPKPDNLTKPKCDENSEYDVFWPCAICSIGCPTQDHLRDHLLNHNLIELSDAIAISTQPMFRKKIITIHEPDFMDQFMKSEHQISQASSESESHASPIPVGNSRKRVTNREGLRSRDPHSCHVCGKVLSSRGNLSKHLIIHNAQKPFSCDVCKATFNAKRDKDLHYIQHHTNRRESVCEICGKGFSCRRLLQEHYTSHDKSKCYPCSKCSKSFQTKKSLKRHLKRHNTSKSYHCDICFKIFKVKYDLRGHMRKVHFVKETPNKENNNSLNDTALTNPDNLLSIDSLLTEPDSLSREVGLGQHQQMEDSVTALIDSDFTDANMLLTSTDRSFLVDNGDIDSKGLIFFPNQTVSEFMEPSNSGDLATDMAKEDLVPLQEVPQTFVIVKMMKEDQEEESSTDALVQIPDDTSDSTCSKKPMKNLPSILRRPKKS